MALAAPSKRMAPVKVGLLVLLSLTATMAIVLWLQGRSFNQGPSFTVRFRDVDGLSEGAAVQLMGIRVGFIKHIQPVIENGRYSVALTFSLSREDIPIVRGSNLSIQQSGLVGEKFLEITPPQLHQISVTLPTPRVPIPTHFPLKFRYGSQDIRVGTVEHVHMISQGAYSTLRCDYRLNTPGVQMPANPMHQIVLAEFGKTPYLLITSRDAHPLTVPDNKSYFTVETPMRLKRFLEIQLASAEALKETNDKINQLMSDETIMTLRNTLKNTEHLTAEATQVMTGANSLFKKTSQDLDRLVASGQQLTDQITLVTQEVNKMVGDPAIQANLSGTLVALRESGESLTRLLKDPNLKQTLALTRDASQDAAAVLHTVRQSSENLNLQARLDDTLTQLDTSLTELESVLKSVNQLTVEQQSSIQSIVNDTRDTAKQLQAFSHKLNGHFTLFKLLF